MMQRKSFGLMMAVALLALPGCIETQPQVQRPVAVKEVTPVAACPTFTEVKAHQVVEMLLDRSCSVLDESQERMVTIRDDATQIVRQLPPGTVVFVRYISDHSYDDRERYLTRDSGASEPNS